MNVLIADKNYELGSPINFGGEGEIYLLNLGNEAKCLKVFDYEKRTPFNERKIVALINKFRRLQLFNIEQYIAFPETPVYDSETGQFCGFTMKYFGEGYIPLFDFKYSNDTYKYGVTNFADSDILKLIDNLFFYLQVLHKAGFILGDINPENILVEKKSLVPAFVDFDSVQVGSFYSTSRRIDYADPNVTVDGYGPNKYFIYTVDSDIYSMCIIAYELLLGSKPHFFQTKDPTETNFKKGIDLSLLNYYVENHHPTGKLPLLATKNSFYNVMFRRLQYLEEYHNDIYEFFKNIFIIKRRDYYTSQKREIVINKRQSGLDMKKVDLLSRSKNDPFELKIFMQQFDINVP